MTFTAFTTCDNKDKAIRIAGALEKICPAPFGVGIFELEDGSNIYEIGSYFLEKPNDIKLTLLSSAFNAKPFVVSEVPETDWVAHVKRELPPVNAGRFSILGSHDFDKASRENVNLVIDAAMAFGTGHHATTKGCLLALEKLVKNKFKPNAVIDVGAGTAVLIMAAAKIWDGLFIASDIDQVAVETSAANILANNLEHKIICINAFGFDHAKIQSSVPFQLIFANILMKPLIKLAPKMTDVSQANHTVAILSGILASQAALVIAKYKEHGWICEDRISIGDWTTITLALKL